MQSFEDILSSASPEDIELMLEKIAAKKMLLGSEEQDLRSQSAHIISSSTELASKTEPMLNLGPFSLTQDVPGIITIHEMDLDDCRSFLCDYLGQGQKYGNRRGSVSSAELIVNGQSRSISLNLSSKTSLNATVIYDAKSKKLHFEVIQGKSKKDKTQLLSAYLQEQLSSFFNSTYDADGSFKPRLYAEGKVVDFEETEFSGSLSQSAAAVSSTSEVAVVVSTEIEQPTIENTLEVGKADSSERKRTGSGSTDSEPQLGSIVDANFFVKTMVNPKTAGLSFAVSPLRPDTYLGRQQGAHITAYIVFVTAILETVDEQSISEIPDLLVAAAMQFVPSSQWESFQHTLQELIKDNPFFEKRERKQLTAGLRDTVQETTVRFIKKSVKIHYAVVLAHLIDDLSNQILMAINKSESTLYARAGRPKSRQELGQEGAKIRNAMKNLREIVAGISMKTAASLIEQFSVFSMTDSDVAAGEDKVMTSRHNTRSRAPSSSKSSAGLSDNIASLIFDLFDFDYYEYTSSAILGKIESSVLEEMKDLEKDLKKLKKVKCLTAGQITERAEVADKIQACKDVLEILGEIEEMETPEERWRELMSIRDNEGHFLNVWLRKLAIMDVSSQIAAVIKDISYEAPHIMSQHLDIVMNHAFSGLRCLSQIEWDNVCSKFNTMVGISFHWDQMPAIMRDSLALQPNHPSVEEAKASEKATIGDTSSSKTFGNY